MSSTFWGGTNWVWRWTYPWWVDFISCRHSWAKVYFLCCSWVKSLYFSVDCFIKGLPNVIGFFYLILSDVTWKLAGLNLSFTWQYNFRNLLCILDFIHSFYYNISISVLVIFSARKLTQTYAGRLLNCLSICPWGFLIVFGAIRINNKQVKLLVSKSIYSMGHENE